MRLSEGPFLNFLARLSAGGTHFAVLNISNSVQTKHVEKTIDLLQNSFDFLVSVDFTKSSN